MNFIKKVIAHSNEQEAPSLLNFDLFTDFSHANVKGDHLENHTPLAADLNVYIATLLGCDPLVISMVYFAGKTHDEGKASSIPDETLLSPRKLTRTERNVVNLHARKTVELTSAIHVFNNAVPCVGGMCSVNTINGHHHERFDGKGYEGIKNIT